jgi:hypothetical protein
MNATSTALSTPPCLPVHRHRHQTQQRVSNSRYGAQHRRELPGAGGPQPAGAGGGALQAVARPAARPAGRRPRAARHPVRAVPRCHAERTCTAPAVFLSPAQPPSTAAYVLRDLWCTVMLQECTSQASQGHDDLQPQVIVTDGHGDGVLLSQALGAAGAGGAAHHHRRPRGVDRQGLPQPGAGTQTATFLLSPHLLSSLDQPPPDTCRARPALALFCMPYHAHMKNCSSAQLWIF